jgi:hypothetical protein
MYRDHENFLVYAGEHYSVFFHAETPEFSSVCDYYKDCDDATRASLLNLVKRISDTGYIYDDTKFRIEDKQHKIYCFKPRKDRFFCFFFTGKKIIITSGHPKKKQKLDRRELEKAIRIRSQYQ